MTRTIDLSTRPLTVLIVGGYGTFGGRLARLLADEGRLTLLIGGRSLERAQEFCAQVLARAVRGAAPGAADVGPWEAGDATSGADLAADRVHRASGAPLRPVHFDRDGSLESQLRELAPDVVVDASGPFQSYGDRPYRLVEACIECGIHYLDLADSTGFVCGIARFDEPARERGVFVLSGVSTFPVLTAAAVRVLAANMARVETITGGVAPSPFANVGRNVIRAIAAYAGKPVLMSGGRVGHPFTDTRRYTIATPGCVPLRSIEFSLVDVPDLQLLATLWPECRSVWMGAGPLPAIWHRVLRGFAWLVRARVLPSLSFLEPVIARAINAFAWGEHRSGMFVRVEGTDANGAPCVSSWHLTAEGDAGPFIPSMAAEAVLRRCLRGNAPVAGARAALRELEVSDYEPLFARSAIRVGVREDDSRCADSAAQVKGLDEPGGPHEQARFGPPLYQRILGSAWHDLPASLRAMHSVQDSMIVRGRADIARGPGWLAARVASVIGFPVAGSDVPVEVRFDVTPARETWTRRFARRSFSSEQFAGKGLFDRLVCERFGPITLALALVVEGARLRLVVRGWTFLGIPLPRALAPYCDAQELECNGRFHFDVAIGHRWLGLIVHYRGWLVAPAVPAAEIPAPIVATPVPPAPGTL